MKSVKTVSGGMLFAMLLCTLYGCTTIEPQSVNDDVDPAVDWTAGLSDKQVVEAMPVTAETIETIDTGLDGGTDTDSVAVGATKSHQISWQVPADALNDSVWNIYNRDDEAVWTPVDSDAVELTVDTVVIDGLAYDVYVAIVTPEVAVAPDSDSATETAQNDVFKDVSPVTDYVVEMVDVKGNAAATAVSIVTLPEGHPVRVTLSDETNSGAPSAIFAAYNSTEETLWKMQLLTNLALPQTVTLAQLLTSDSALTFTVRTDFSDFNFSEPFLMRSSNSSFCRVEEIAPSGPDVLYRLKYSFEDLPLSALSVESGGAFDYNDVVLYADVLRKATP